MKKDLVVIVLAIIAIIVIGALVIKHIRQIDVTIKKTS